MEEPGHQHRSTAATGIHRRRPAAGLRLETVPGTNPFLLHVALKSGLQGVKAKVPFPKFLLNLGRDNPNYKYHCRKQLIKFIYTEF